MIILSLEDTEMVEKVTIEVKSDKYCALGDVMSLIPRLMVGFGYFPGSFANGGMDEINDWVSTLEKEED